MNPSKRISGCQWAAALSGFALGTSLALPAMAMSNFPLEIQNHLGLSYTPPCTFCHLTAQGGGPIVTKFGQSMLAAGLSTSTTSLDTALDKLNTSKTDSDGNGTPDIQQIESGQDPSTGNASGPAIRYGCGAHIALSPVRRFSSSLCAMAVAALAFSRRRAQLPLRGSPNDRMNNS